jgi:hypothetical protein
MAARAEVETRSLVVYPSGSVPCLWNKGGWEELLGGKMLEGIDKEK